MNDTTGAGRAESGTTAPIAQSVAQTAQEKAGQGAGVLTNQASEVADTVKQQAGRVAQETGTEARRLAAQLREQLSGETRAQGERLVQNLRGLAEELQEMGQQGQGDSVATSVVRRLAEGGHQFADHLEQRGPGGLLDEVQDFARRRPGLFLAGAALAGFAVARTGKSVASGSDVHGSGSGSNGNGANTSDAARVQAAQPTAPLPGAGAPVSTGGGIVSGGEAAIPGGYQPPEPAPISRPATGLTGAPPSSTEASEPWSVPETGR